LVGSSTHAGPESSSTETCSPHSCPSGTALAGTGRAVVTVRPRDRPVRTSPLCSTAQAPRSPARRVPPSRRGDSRQQEHASWIAVSRPSSAYSRTACPPLSASDDWLASHSCGTFPCDSYLWLAQTSQAHPALFHHPPCSTIVMEERWSSGKMR